MPSKNNFSYQMLMDQFFSSALIFLNTIFKKINFSNMNQLVDFSQNILLSMIKKQTFCVLLTLLCLCMRRILDIRYSLSDIIVVKELCSWELYLKILQNQSKWHVLFSKLAILTKFHWLFSTFVIMIKKIGSTPEMALSWSLFSDNYFCDWSFIHENRFSTFSQISPNIRYFLSRQGKNYIISSK